MYALKLYNHTIILNSIVVCNLNSKEQRNACVFRFVLYCAQLFSGVQLFVSPWTAACQAPLFMGFSGPEYWSGLPCLPPNPGIELRSPALQMDSLPSEPPRKPKNTGVGSLSLLQGIFPTQESNWGLLHCRQILYQLSYQRSLYLGLHPHNYICK